MEHLSTYQPRALQYGFGPVALEPDFLVPAIVAGVGKLFAHHAEERMNRWAALELQLRLVKTYGSICWHTALLLHTEKVDRMEVPDQFAPGWHGQAPQPMALLLATASQLHSAWLSREHYDLMQESAQRMWLALATQCEEVTRQDFESVLTTNLDRHGLALLGQGLVR